MAESDDAGGTRARGEDVRSRRTRPRQRGARQQELDHRDDRRRGPDGRPARARPDRRSDPTATRASTSGSPTCPRTSPIATRTAATPRRPGISNNKLAMWLFLGSECLLFGGLISTYMLYRGRHSGSLGPDQIYDIPFTSVSSFVLLMSSLTMVLAVSSVGPRRPPQRQAVARRDGPPRRHVRRRPGLRVHVLLPRGPRLHDQPVLVELLHVDRLPRRPRHRRHHHAAVADRDDLARTGCPATSPRSSSSSASTGTSSTSSGSSSSRSST